MTWLRPCYLLRASLRGSEAVISTTVAPSSSLLLLLCLSRSLMHNRETGTGPVAVPSLDEEKEADFDWDQELRVSERARRALEYMRTAMEKYGTVGQPLWPVVLSSLYGVFLAGEERDARILVITFAASVHC